MTTWQTVEPLSDESQDQAYWEPWTPAIGARVRVRLSGECQALWASLPRPSRLGRINWAGHIDGEDGRAGVVRRCPVRACPLCAGALGHSVSVEFDTALQWDGNEWPGGHYAAVELEPLP